METLKDYLFYVGTYTNKESKGIYKYTLSATGKLKEIGLMAKTRNPSFLALSPDKKYLLAVNEVAEDNTGFVSSYAIQSDSLIFINRSVSGGTNPCFITVTKNGQVLTANYTSGSIGLLSLEKNGQLSDLLAIQQHTGKGSTERQKSPHAHSVWVDEKNDKQIISVDLGTNELWISTIDTINHTFHKNPTKIAMEVGAGPRHLAFHPTKNRVYILNELNNTVTMLSHENGTFKTKSSISTLPADFSEFSKGADIHISSDGLFLYASNRGHDSIAIFSIDPQNGGLSLIDFETLKIKTPRNFSLTPDGKFLLVANQDANTLVAFSRNPVTGLLSYASEVHALTPVCIVFN